MRRNIVIIGIIISAIAAFMFIVGMVGLRTASLNRMFDFYQTGTYNAQIAMFGSMFLIGFILLFIGIPMAIIGAILKGEEQKKIQSVEIPQPIQTPLSSQQVPIQQQTADVTKMEEIDRGESMFDRETFLGGIMAIGIGIVMFIFIIWIEPLINDIVNYQWIILIIRLVGAIIILIGIVGIIAAFLPKKEYIQIEEETKK
jgi:hypothetical protein